MGDKTLNYEPNDRLISWMKAQGLNGHQVSKQLGVHNSVIYSILHKRTQISLEIAARLLKAYPDLNCRWLLLGSED